LLVLTARPLLVSPPPDEEWVVVQYRTRRGREHQIRIEWNVTTLPPETAVKHRGVSLETDRVRQIRRFLFEPEIVEFNRRVATGAKPIVKGTDSRLPDIFVATPVQTLHGKFGYVRIKSFQVDNPDDLVLEFLRLIGLLPRRGLIIDVRDNGGGRSAAAERLLQLISPRQPIEPQRVYFINTPLTLELCQLQDSNKDLGPLGLFPWIESVQRSIETGATYSASFPYTDPATCNAIGRQYPGPSIVITNALSYSATEFFAAGFQDHGGKIVGIDTATGGGGANVRTHQELRKWFRKSATSPFKALPKKAQLRVAFRRSVRIGPQSGNDVEGFGITPDYIHSMTRNDLLKRNVDLINYAASLLIQQ
jgi:C-terminal processing protease CtpA/Prc